MSENDQPDIDYDQHPLWQGPPNPNMLQGIAPLESHYGMQPPDRPSFPEYAVNQLAHGAVRGLTDLALTPGRVWGGQYDTRDLPKVGRDYAENWATTVIPGGRAASGTLGIFGGPGAKTANLEQLARAKRMEDAHLSPAEKRELDWYDTRTTSGAGLSQDEHVRLSDLAERNTPAGPQEIHMKTGWFRDKDDNWKFEIPDSNAAWLNAGRTDSKGMPNDQGRIQLPYGGDKLKLVDVLHHPDLYEAYPGAKDIPVGPTGMFAGLTGLKGSYSKEGGLRLTGGKEQDIVSTTLHEIQHHIQEQEGFAQGGNTGQFLPSGFDKEFQTARDAFRATEDKMQAAGVNPYTYKNARASIEQGKTLMPHQQEALDKVTAVDPGLHHEWTTNSNTKTGYEVQRDEAFDKYQSLAGEVEARNVQERHATGNYGSHPHNTQGYPQGDQIVKFTGPGDQASIDAFHGSPHEFAGEEGAPLGRFSDAKIGTGEGNQSFGHGHYVAEVSDTAENYQKAGVRTGSNEGHLYNVEIKPDKHELLDLDKKLSEQTPDIQAKLEKLPEHFKESLGEHAENRGHNSPFDAPEDYTGHEFTRLGGHPNVTDHPEEFSQMLHEVGIPGNKYLDQQSRGRAILTRKDIKQLEDAIGEHEKHIANAQEDLDRNKNNPNLLPGFFSRRQDVIDWSKDRIAAHQQKIADMKEDKHLTHNFVIFHPHNLKITGKNGEPISPVEHDPFQSDLSPVDHDPFAEPVHPKYPGAKLAPNGRWYTPDPDRPGKWLEPPQ